MRPRRVRIRRPPQPPPPNEDGTWDVAAVTQHRIRSGRLLLRVHWCGYGRDDDTWEPPESFPEGNIPLKRYVQSHSSLREWFPEFW